MRLNGYLINEDITDINEIVDFLKEKCSIFIKESNGLMVYRGDDHLSSDNKFIIKHSRLQDRRPSSTPKYWHDILNGLFKKKFGWNVRNGIFTSSNCSVVSVYGRPRFFYPIGAYRYCWSPAVEDLYSEDFIMSKPKLKDMYNIFKDRGGREYYCFGRYEKLNLDSPEKFLESITEYVEEEIISTYKGISLPKGIASGNEIVFECKEYVLSMINHFGEKLYE